MKDIKVISTRVLLTVESINPIRGFLPPAIVVVGQNMNLASEIRYNDAIVPELFVVANNRLIARVPDSQIGKPLNSISVFANTRSVGKDTVVSLSAGSPFTTVSGMDRLVQSWIMTFMTTPGTNIFSPSSGGGAQTIIGKTTNRSGDSVSADLAMAVSRTKSEILNSQARGRSIPLSEKLLNCSITSVNFDPTTSVLSATVSIQNMAGQQAEVSLG